MEPSHFSNNSLFRSNTLNLRDKSGKIGAYMFMADALIIPSGDKEIRQHEIAHRILAHYDMGFSSFHVVSHLAGINYTLLWTLGKILQKNRAFLHGKQLGKFHVTTIGEGEKLKWAVNSLLQRIEYVENLIDMTWHGLAPIAELLAIDFAEGADKATAEWNISQPKLTETEFIENKNKKLDYIEALISEYPTTFGGYHVKFGSFQNAMRTVWNVYDGIESEMVRKELLRLCSYVTFIDDNDQIQIREPISLILENAPIAQKYGDVFAVRLKMEREIVGAKSEKLLNKVRQYVLADIPKESLDLQDIVNAMHLLVRTQSEAWSQGNFPPLPIRELTVYSIDAGLSFLRFEYGKENNEQQVRINPLFLLRAAQRNANISGRVDKENIANHEWDNDLPTDWWRKLILLEAFRQAVKNGSPLTCPLLGWKVVFQAWLLVLKDSLNLEIENIECHSDCFIRKWLQNAHTWSELSPSKGFCNLDDET